MKKLSFLALLLVTQTLSLLAQPALPEGFTSEVVFKGAYPVTFAADHHGRLFIAEKKGRIVLLENDETATTLIQLLIENCCEHGLLGITLDPDFEINHFVYVHYTVFGENHNRVSRFHFREDIKTLESEEILLELEPLSGAFHSGGCLRFGPDNMLYVATGDGSNSLTSQNLNSLSGKVLRINPDGSIPADNPFYNTNKGAYRAIYAYGFRNPFTFSFNEDGRLFLNDVGFNSFEEINEVFAGKNYGWPKVEGKLKEDGVAPDNYVDPILSYGHSEGCAITGAAFYPRETTQFPDEYRGKYFFGDYCNGKIRMLDTETLEVSEFATGTVRPIALAVTEAGDFYYVSYSEEIIKIFYASDGSPRVTSQPKSLIAVVGEAVQFEISVNGTEPLQYQWKKDGIAIPDANGALLRIENVQLIDDNTVITCNISNSVGSIETDTAILRVTDRTRPVVELDLSYNNATYQAGDTIIIVANATDEIQGPLPYSSLTWKVEFHHNVHVHPVISDQVGTDSVAFVVQRIGETSSNVWYGIQLIAENDAGLQTSVYREIFPDKSTFTVKTSTDSLVVFLDGKPLHSPYQITSVVGMTRSLSVDKAQYLGDSIYYFNGWNDGESSSETIFFNVNEADTTYQADYRRFFLGHGLGLTGTYYNSIKDSDTVSVLTRVDKTIDFDWGRYSPVRPIKIDTFKIVWDGYFEVPEDGEYTFTFASDDGIIVTVDDQIVINDNGAKKGGRTNTFKLSGNAGRPYKINIQYFELAGYSSIRMFWSSAKIQKSIVPVSALYPDYPEPEVTISSSPTFSIGEEMIFEGTGKDSHGNAISADGFSWEIYIIDNDHRTLLFAEAHTSHLSLAVPDSLSDNIYAKIEAVFTAVDSKGFRKKTSFVKSAALAKLKITCECDTTFVLNAALNHLPFDSIFVAGHEIDTKFTDVIISHDSLFFIQQEFRNGSHFRLLQDTLLHVKFDTLILSNGTGLQAAYYSRAKTFESTPDSVKNNVTVYHQWTEEINQNGFKIHWSGWITPPIEGYYYLKIRTTKKASIFIEEEIFSIDGSVVLTDRNPYFLKKEGYYPLQIFYETDDDRDTVALEWYSDVLPLHVLPREQMFETLPEVNEETVKFFPNPFGDVLGVDLSKFNALIPIEVTLISLDGATLISEKIEGRQSIFMSTGKLNKGIYLLKIVLQDRIYVFKVCKG